MHLRLIFSDLIPFIGLTLVRTLKNEGKMMSVSWEINTFLIPWRMF